MKIKIIKRSVLLLLLSVIGSNLQAQIVTHGPFIGAVTENSARVFVRTSIAAPVDIFISTDPLFSIQMTFNGIERLVLTDPTRWDTDGDLLTDDEEVNGFKVTGFADPFRTHPTLPDTDGDGVNDEVLIGEMSALEIFVATQDTPVRLRARRAARKGIANFHAAGCSDCHRPMMTTENPWLDFSFPVVDDDPSANVYYRVDLRRGSMGFKPSSGGVEVSMFSDLKRHNMGPDLAEDFSAASDQQNREYITAKLWGVADTAPYMHDGRALTLEEAIASHGGDAEWARDRFLSMDERRQEELIAFLKTLRNPLRPNADIVH